MTTRFDDLGQILTATDGTLSLRFARRLAVVLQDVVDKREPRGTV